MHCVLFGFGSHSVRVGEAQFVKTRPNFLISHEQAPQKTAPVVFDHYDLRPLVNCEVRPGYPAEV